MTTPMLYLMTIITIAINFNVSNRQTQSMRPEIQLNVSTPRTIFKEREPIPVRIELANLGKEDFLVGRQLNNGSYTSPSYTSITLSDASKGTTLEVQDLSEFLTPKTIATWWLAIPPKHFYGVEVVLDNLTTKALNKPGRYLLKAEYTSSGGSTIAVPTAGIPSHKVWSGKLESNTITIEIVPER